MKKSEIGALKLADLNDALANTKNQISDIKIELIEKNEIIKELEKKLNQKENLFFENHTISLKKMKTKDLIVKFVMMIKEN